MGRNKSRKKALTNQATQSVVKPVSTSSGGGNESIDQIEAIEQTSKQGKKARSTAKKQRRALYNKRHDHKTKMVAVAGTSSSKSLASPLPPSGPSSPPSHPTSLTSLPDELLKHILLLSDLPCALAMSLVSRHLSPIAEHRIWREVDISASLRHAEKYDEARVLAEFDAKVSSILAGADDTRASMVRELRITREAGHDRELAALADAVSPYIRSLILLSFYGYDFDCITDDINYDRDSLDIHLLEYSLEREQLGATMSFPNLTHVHIGQFALHCIQFIPLICQWAPNLESLYAYFGIFRDISSPHPISNLDFPPLIEADTKIRSLVYYYDSYVHGGIPEHGEGQVILSLLKHCPLLELLSVDEGEETSESIGDAELHGAISNLRSLRDLHWPYGGFGQRDDDAQIPSEPRQVPVMELLSLRRLFMVYNDWASPTEEGDIGLLPIAPNLHAICFDIGYRYPVALVTMASPRTIHPTFAEWLRNTPNLHIIHTCCLSHHSTIDSPTIFPYFDQHQELGTSTGSIRSYHFQGHELLHIRHQVQDVDAWHTIYVQKQDLDRVIHQRVLYAKGQEFGRREYARAGDPVWEDWTDFEGVAVPMDVLQEMRVVSGMDAGEWKKRGVEVNEEAWQVLLDWRKGRIAEGRTTAE